MPSLRCRENIYECAGSVRTINPGETADPLESKPLVIGFPGSGAELELLPPLRKPRLSNLKIGKWRGKKMLPDGPLSEAPRCQSDAGR
jgi:hypothetical protein